MAPSELACQRRIVMVRNMMLVLATAVTVGGAALTPTVSISDVTAPISAVISATSVMICAPGILPTHHEIWRISAATAGTFGSIEGTCDATTVICSSIVTAISGYPDGVDPVPHPSPAGLARGCSIARQPNLLWRRAAVGPQGPHRSSPCGGSGKSAI